MNPRGYNIVTLQGQGLCINDYIRPFSKFARKKIDVNFQELATSSDELIEEFDQGGATIYGSSYKVKKHGYPI